MFDVDRRCVTEINLWCSNLSETLFDSTCFPLRALLLAHTTSLLPSCIFLLKTPCDIAMDSVQVPLTRDRSLNTKRRQEVFSNVWNHRLHVPEPQHHQSTVSPASGDLFLKAYLTKQFMLCFMNSTDHACVGILYTTDFLSPFLSDSSSPRGRHFLFGKNSAICNFRPSGLSREHQNNRMKAGREEVQCFKTMISNTSFGSTHASQCGVHELSCRDQSPLSHMLMSLCTYWKQFPC